MLKHEWRKKEKKFYLPKTRPEFIEIPEFKYATISGEGNPNDPFFSNYITALYAMSYTLKMTTKKMEIKPPGYTDYVVYPLEGVWDINERARKKFDGKINKDDLVFKLMIRQPDFVDHNLFYEILELAKRKKEIDLLKEVKYEKIEEGTCVQMMHVGSYDNEPESFALMEKFAQETSLKRLSKRHREIYLSDFRKVPPEKLKTVLRFKVTRL